MKIAITSICFLLLGFYYSSDCRAQSLAEDNTVALVRANYLYQFAVNNNWPKECKTGKFKVAIVGNLDLFEVMATKYGSKPIGAQSMEIIAQNEFRPDQNYHMIFLDKSRKADLARIVKAYKGSATLIITNFDSALKEGSHINFRNLEGNIRFELNKPGIDESGISAGVKILQWALS
ncbi:MAG: YfiR family protein [Flavobacteriales bacterium]